MTDCCALLKTTKQQLLLALSLVAIVFVMVPSSPGFASTNGPGRLFQYYAKCPASGPCEPSVGSLVRRDGVCTAMLVGPEVIGTNLHCLPEGIRSPGASCAGKMEVVFPAVGNREQEVIECLEVLALAPPLGDQVVRPDYAFLRLRSRSTRSPFLIHRAGIQDQQSLTIFRMNPKQGFGEQERITCKAVQKSLINPHFNSPWSPVFAMPHCPIIEGNSGSPALSSDGAMVGIVSLAQVTQTEKGTGRHGGGSNLACVAGEWFGDRRPVPSTCHEELTDQQVSASAQKQVQTAIKDLRNDLQKTIEKVIAEYNSRPSTDIFMNIEGVRLRGTETSQDGLEESAEQLTRNPAEDSGQPIEPANEVSARGIFTMIPTCFHPLRLPNTQGKTVTRIVPVKRWTALTGTDENMQYQARTREETWSLELSFSTTRSLTYKDRLEVQWRGRAGTPSEALGNRKLLLESCLRPVSESKI